MKKGIYCLIITVDKIQKIKIGKRLESFQKGYYCYIGSALNNLDKRIERHKRDDKKMYWHIDYFLKKAKIIDVKTIETNEKIECKISKKMTGSVIMAKFGSSDCKCKTHLYYYKTNPLKNKEFLKVFK